MWETRNLSAFDQGGGAIEIQALCDVVGETSFDIHRLLRHGHLEKIYENALAHSLKKED